MGNATNSEATRRGPHPRPACGLLCVLCFLVVDFLCKFFFPLCCCHLNQIGFWNGGELVGRTLFSIFILTHQKYIIAHHANQIVTALWTVGCWIYCIAVLAFGWPLAVIYLAFVALFGVDPKKIKSQ
eukprot:c5331_g1_i2.p1 GENE.c5331_g1_i2~~c5331_g1_i2.p1  ORF type:complete len:127 (+),score=14.56 c5331_g1_i2:158-538(+)